MEKTPPTPPIHTATQAWLMPAVSPTATVPPSSTAPTTVHTDGRTTQTLSEFLKGYLQQSLNVLKHPVQLIPTLILGMVWMALSVAASYVKLWLPFQFLSFLTFSQGGMYGGFFGAVGGIMGKVVVAAFLNVMIVPLFTGKKPFNSVGDGARALGNILKVNGMKALGPLFLAAGIALLIYSFLNITQIGQNAMVGVVAAIMLLKNIGLKGGFAWDFLLSAVGAMSGRKMPDMQTINRILTGAAIGFTLAAALSLVGLHLCAWIGWYFTVAGTVFTIIGQKKNI